MSTVNSTSGTVPQSLLDAMNPRSAGTAADAVSEAQDRFMQLLVTQMKNQDPLNPMDNAEVTSQMAQLSTVTGINKLNGTLESLLNGYSATQTLQAASMIGHGVLVPDNKVSLVEGQALLGLDLAADADSVVVSILDKSGNEVQKLELGGRSAGVLPLSWDGSKQAGGKAEDGVYTMEVKASKAGVPVAASTLYYADVVSITTTGGGMKLNLGNSRSVSLADARQIL